MKKDKSLMDKLFNNKKHDIYMVIDGASVKNLLVLLDDHPAEYSCLYTGHLPHDVEMAAPYLVKSDMNHEFSRLMILEGWGNHWGIFASIPENIKYSQVKRHFRSFIRVEKPDGKIVFFRYYDPRVFNNYIPTCNQEELKKVFGPVTEFITEGLTPAEVNSFRFEQDLLEHEAIQM